MLHAVAVWLLVAGFAGAGAFNALGREGTRRDFVRWGYPAWWCRVTGVLELGTAVLIALHACRPVGLGLGAAVIAAGVATVLRQRDWRHLPPLGLFAVVLAVAAATG